MVIVLRGKEEDKISGAKQLMHCLAKVTVSRSVRSQLYLKPLSRTISHTSGQGRGDIVDHRWDVSRKRIEGMFPLVLPASRQF